MKEDRIYDGITNISEDLIEWAGNYEFRKNAGKQIENLKRMWITLASVAACLLLVFATPLLLFATRRFGSAYPPGADGTEHAPHGSVRPGDTQTNPTMPGSVTPSMSTEFTDYVWVYYVKGGELCSEQQEVTFRESDTWGACMFAAWKKKNGIGEDVQLLDFETWSNRTTGVKDGMVEHIPGDYHCLYLTVSKSLETYYNRVDETLLLESLKQTMTGYSGVEYQEYHLMLE